MSTDYCDFNFFYYKKIEGPKTNPRDLRIQLKKIINAKFKGKKLKEIPEEFEIKLNSLICYKYVIIFDNKEECNPKQLFSINNFNWVKGIDEQEHGIIE